MGKFDGKFLRGTVGDVVFKKVLEQQIVQGKTKKKKIKQTQNTKNASTTFGKASNLAADIRVALSPTIGDYDSMMISRFTGETTQVLNAAIIPGTKTFDFSIAPFNRFNGFEFNNTSPVRDRFFAQPSVTASSNGIKIAVPEMQIPQDLRFPSSAKKCVLAFQVALFDLKNGRYLVQDVQYIEIKYKYKPEVIPPAEFSFEAETGCLCVITLTLQYITETFSGNSVINNKSFNPAAILKAFMLPGVVNASSTKRWKRMSFKAN